MDYPAGEAEQSLPPKLRRSARIRETRNRDRRSRGTKSVPSARLCCRNPPCFCENLRTWDSAPAFATTNSEQVSYTGDCIWILMRRPWVHFWNSKGSLQKSTGLPKSSVFPPGTTFELRIGIFTRPIAGAAASSPKICTFRKENRTESALSA